MNGGIIMNGGIAPGRPAAPGAVDVVVPVDVPEAPGGVLLGIPTM